MPSIPQSLLWISLVVLWLFVLVPMLVNKRDAVRRTSDVALATRVLNTGSGRASRLIKRGGPAAGHASDPSWQREQELDEDDEYDEDATGPVVVTGRPSRVRSVAVVTALAEEDEADYLDVDVVGEDSGALPVGAMRAGLQDDSPATEELQLDFSSAATEPEVAEAPAEQAAEEFEQAVEEFEQAAEEEPVDEELTGLDEAAKADLDEVAEAPVEEEFDGTEDEYEYIDDTSGLEAEADPPTTVTHLSRDRRFDSKTSAAVSARKFRFRKNVLLVMAAMLLASAGTAFLVAPAAWWAFATVGVITLLYLGYLRRQTRIEERLRRRRMQRMARSRLGVENTHDHDLDVVPARLRRPGTIVLEIDDEDPEFEHLDDIPFAREFDLPRAAGQ